MNYQDENLNISIPVFSIHGNHDDPTGVSLPEFTDQNNSSKCVEMIVKFTYAVYNYANITD